MATYEFDLVSPPEGKRARELWIQHAAGVIFIEDVRNFALESLPANLTPNERQIATEAVNNTLFGLMSVVDGVTGGLGSESGRERVWLSVVVNYERTGESGEREELYSLDLFDGDGVCMGVHGWLEGDFGASPVVVPRAKLPLAP